MASFEELNAQVLGISVDHVPCLQAWAESLGGIHYPLLSDFWPHGAVAECYGVLRKEEGHSERAIFVIDKKGYIRYIDIHDIDDRPDNEEVRKALRKIEEEDAAHSAGARNAEAHSAGSRSAGTRNPAAAPAVPPFAYFGEPEEKAETSPQGDIVLYCTRWCKDCKKAKTWLAEHGLEYVEVDIDYDMTARNQVRQWANGFLVTPVIEMYGTIILDFDQPKLEETLRKHSDG